MRLVGGLVALLWVALSTTTMAAATTRVDVPERLPWPQPTHIVFVADAVKANDVPLTVVLSWQPARMKAGANGQPHVAARVLRPGQVVGRVYPFRGGASRAKPLDPPAGRFAKLPVGVEVQNDGDGGVVLTLADVGAWQTAGTTLPKRVVGEVPLVVEPTTLRLWVQGPSAFSQPAPAVAKAKLLGSHSVTSGQAVLVSHVDVDTAVLLDEGGAPLVLSAPPSTPAFFVDTEAGCGQVLPRALVLPLASSPGAAPELLRLLSTEGVACDVVTAVVTVRGQVVRKGRNVRVQGVWLQHLR